MLSNDYDHMEIELLWLPNPKATIHRFRTTAITGVECFMPDSRIYVASNGVQLSNDSDSGRDHAGMDASKPSRATESDRELKYVAISPSDTALQIPKELFVALSDFMKTRKCPGSITIQFRRGEIICVEAIAKKTYRNP